MYLYLNASLHQTSQRSWQWKDLRTSPLLILAPFIITFSGNVSQHPLSQYDRPSLTTRKSHWCISSRLHTPHYVVILCNEMKVCGSVCLESCCLLQIGRQRSPLPYLLHPVCHVICQYLQYTACCVYFCASVIQKIILILAAFLLSH